MRPSYSASSNFSSDSSIDARTWARRSSIAHSGRARPTTGMLSSPRRWSWYTAGMSFFLARSPVMPSMTRQSERGRSIGADLGGMRIPRLGAVVTVARGSLGPARSERPRRERDELRVQ